MRILDFIKDLARTLAEREIRIDRDDYQVTSVNEEGRVDNLTTGVKEFEGTYGECVVYLETKAELMLGHIYLVPITR